MSVMVLRTGVMPSAVVQRASGEPTTLTRRPARSAAVAAGFVHIMASGEADYIRIGTIPAIFTSSRQFWQPTKKISLIAPMVA